MFHRLLLPPRRNSYAYLIVESVANWMTHLLLCDSNKLYRLQHPSLLKESGSELNCASHSNIKQSQGTKHSVVFKVWVAVLICIKRCRCNERESLGGCSIYLLIYMFT